METCSGLLPTADGSQPLLVLLPACCRARAPRCLPGTLATLFIKKKANLPAACLVVLQQKIPK